MRLENLILWMEESLHLPRILGALLISVVLILLAKIIREVFWRFLSQVYAKKSTWKGTNERDKTILSIARSTLTFLIYFFTAVIILDLFGINTASVLTAAGIGGIALAFGAQRIIADLFSGLFILVDGDLNVGDWVEFAGKEGEVVEIGLRRTKIIQYTGVLIIVPNSEIKTIINYRTTRNRVKCDVTLSVPIRLAPEEAQTIFQPAALALYRDQGDFFLEEPTYMGIDQVNAYSYLYRIGLVSDYDHRFAAQRKVREACLKALQDHRPELLGQGPVLVEGE